MAIRDQRIDIGHGIEKVRRVVYDYRSDEAWRIQTGYVQYDNSRVPVWREYDPDNSGHGAGWRTGLWRNIYSLVMSQAVGAKYVSYEMTGHEVRPGEVAMLPKTEVRLTYLLREHLARLPDDPSLTSSEH